VAVPRNPSVHVVGSAVRPFLLSTNNASPVEVLTFAELTSVHPAGGCIVFEPVQETYAMRRSPSVVPAGLLSVKFVPLVGDVKTELVALNAMVGEIPRYFIWDTFEPLEPVPDAATREYAVAELPVIHGLLASTVSMLDWAAVSKLRLMCPPSLHAESEPYIRPMRST
jgi:hypothetical protein